MYEAIGLYTNNKYLNITGLLWPLCSVFASSESERQVLKIQKGDNLKENKETVFLHQFNEAMYVSAGVSWWVGSNPEPRALASLIRVLSSHGANTRTKGKNIVGADV